MEDKYLTVGIVTKYLKSKFDNDENLKQIYIKGELSNCKFHSSGHLYFSIKDETSKINAIMFNNNAKNLLFNPVDGTKVLVMGRISIYEQTGNYQIYVEEMLEDGVGNLYIAFEKLKKQLEEEGLFDYKYKKEIPAIPERIGVVTAPTGAAIKDILTTIKRRFPLTEVIIFPSLVQGDGSAKNIAENIEKAQNYNLDLLIIGRGGGSIEDLWAFNEEIVARAIFKSDVPIISAVGHEIDFTIADFVADRRAATPTAAAELAVPNIIDIIKYNNQLKIRLYESVNKKLNYNRLIIDSLKNSFILKNPMILYENKKIFIDQLNEKISSLILHKLDKRKTEFSNIVSKLQILNPLNILQKGYSIVYKNNELIKDSESVNVDDLVTIKLSNGQFKAIVKEK
ncbi:MAG: exodeoxyribonuclease VII large subunit [Bacilli bacterium]|nr:exodeoxyribonuclease VII large subunit [Bacilli bacterium]MDD4733689.1 exodeoxyribonuclease VII large subunit [Bacilli bacterium]